MRALPHLWRLTSEFRKTVPCEFLPVPFNGRIVPDTRRSDHASFWDLGYPAIMVTDTATTLTAGTPVYYRVIPQ